MACCSGLSGYAIRGWIAVFGGFLVHLTLGTLYTFGNMSPYLTSYLRAYKDPTIQYTDSVWVFGICAACQGIAMFLGGIINTRFGPRITTLIGGFTLSTGTILTGLALTQSFPLCIVTYGVMVGVGTGIAYAPPLACAMKWLPNHKGFVNGIVVAGFGGGAFIFDQVQTAFINPDNLSPDEPLEPGSSEMYYSAEHAGDLLHRVPRCFYLLGSCYAAMQLIGCLMMSDPPLRRDPEHDALIGAGNDDYDPIDREEEPEPKPETLSVHPKHVLRQRSFYTLWFIFLLNGQAVLFISTLYKTYGQTFIQDDKFLALLGACASVCNAVGRIFWGKLVDRYSFKACMMSLSAFMVALMATLLATPYGGKPMFFVWICLIFLDFSGNFALLPTVTAKAYGPRYVAINYGLVFTSQAVTGFVGAILTTTLSDILGWQGMFFLVAGFSLLSMILTATFSAKDRTGKSI